MLVPRWRTIVTSETLSRLNKRIPSAGQQKKIGREGSVINASTPSDLKEEPETWRGTWPLSIWRFLSYFWSSELPLLYFLPYMEVLVLLLTFWTPPSVFMRVNLRQQKMLKQRWMQRRWGFIIKILKILHFNLIFVHFRKEVFWHFWTRAADCSITAICATTNQREETP